MAYGSDNGYVFDNPPIYRGGVNIETISGDKTLTMKDSSYQHINASAGSLNVILPSPVDGAVFTIMCIGNPLMVQDHNPTNIKSLSVDEGAMFVSNGVIWKQIL